MGTSGEVVRGWVPLTWWQMDVIGPLPGSEGYKLAITGVDTARGLSAAYPAQHLDQKAVIAAQERLCAAYGRPLIIASDQGTHFTGALIQRWARDLQMGWKFPVAHHPQAAGMIERYNGLLQQGLRAAAATPTLRVGRKACGLSSGLYMRGVRGRRPAPVDALLHWTAAAIQLHVQTKDALLKPGMGKQEYFLSCSTGPGARANSHLDVALGNKSLSHVLGGSCCPLGPRGGEKLTNSALGDWDVTSSLKGDIPRANKPHNASSWHLCDLPMAHYEFSHYCK